MSFLAAGSADTVILLAGQIIGGSGHGLAVLGPGPQRGTMFNLRGASWSVGPFDRTQIVYLSASTTDGGGGLVYTAPSLTGPGYEASPSSIARGAAPGLQDAKITTRDGTLLVGGEDYRGVFINAYDQLINILAGGSSYQTDLPDIALSGAKLIRVSLGPTVAADWTTQVGTSGTAPVAGFLPAVRTLLDAADANGLGVVFVMYWLYSAVPQALGRTVTDYQTPGSITRTYMKDLAATVARNFKNHPALAAYQVGNEWFDRASLADFATTPQGTPNTGVDHFGALVGVQNDVVAGIRAWDPDRSVWTASGTNSRYSSGTPELFIQKLISAAGNCDVVDLHYYPDTDRSGFQHVGSGRAPDMGSGGAFFLPMVRTAVLQAGKVLVVGEVGADDDNTSYGSTSMGALSQTCWRHAMAAGCELVGEWGFYAVAAIASDLKTQRRAVLPLIRAFNAQQTAGFIKPPAPYPALGRYPHPSRCARGTGAAGGWISIPNHPDLFLDQVATARMVWMFWLRKRAVLGNNPRIFSNNDGTQGYLLTSNGNEGLGMQISFAGAFNSISPNGNFFNYPADVLPDPTRSLPGDWVHHAIEWNGVPTATPQDDGLQHFTIWIHGIPYYREAFTGKVANGISPQPLFLMAQSDGLGNWANVDMFDFMVGKNFTLTSQMLADYIQRGLVPAGIQHQWPLKEDARDVRGNLHGTVGPGIKFVPNDIGALVP